MIETPSQEEIRKSLKASLWDGIFGSLTVGLAEIYFSPFVLFLGAPPLLFGLLTTLPQLIGSLSQLSSPRLVDFLRSPKKTVLWGAFGQALLLVGTAFIPFSPRFRLAFFFLANSLYWICWMIALPAWQSWMGDLVPPDERGRYFGLRNRILQISTFLALLAGGWILDRSQNHEATAYGGFFLLFLLGASGRLLSCLAISRQTDLQAPAASTRPSFTAFLKNLTRHSFGLFVLYSTLFSLAVNIAGPYFISYLLEEIRFSYLQFMVLMGAMVLAKFLSLPLWGRASDRSGPLKPFLLSSLLFSILPFFWLASRQFYYLLFLHLFAGAALAGFELCSFHFLLGNTERENRTYGAAYYETLAGVGVVCGSVLGGLLLRHPLFGIKAYLSLFLISGVLRMLLSLSLLPKIQKASTRASLKASELAPIWEPKP
ncbi:MAG: MFS transporter [bacterium]